MLGNKIKRLYYFKLFVILRNVEYYHTGVMYSEEETCRDKKCIYLRTSCNYNQGLDIHLP